MSENGKDHEAEVLEKLDLILELLEQHQESLEELLEKIGELELTSNEGFSFDS